MSRKAEFSGSYDKPASLYLEWSSDDKAFRFYNHQTKSNELFNQDLKFLVLKEMHTVKGWHDKSQSGIYSNEVKNIGSEQLEVKSFKGGTLARGVYKEIKDIVSNVGGRYVKSVYAMLEDGSVVNFSFKGAVVQQWGDTFNKARKRFGDEWVVLDTIEDRKKGKVSFSVPVFKFGGSLTDEQSKAADSAYDALELKLSNKPTREAEVVDVDDSFEDFSEDVDF